MAHSGFFALSPKRTRAGFFVVLVALASIFYPIVQAVSGINLLPVAEAAPGTGLNCEITASANIVRRGSTITLTWTSSGYTAATINGEAVSVSSGSRSYVISAHSAYRFEAKNPRGSTCVVTVTITCLPPPPPLPPPPINPAIPPVVPPIVLPIIPPVPPNPDARAFIAVSTDGFATPLTSGQRNIAATANITLLNWRSLDAVSCEGRGFAAGEATSGSIVSGNPVIKINQGETKVFGVRCKNTGNEWSAWQVVEISKDALPGTGVNTAPDAPTIHGADISTSAPVTGLVNQVTPFTISAIDPDSDDMLYQLDWDRNGVVDTVLPVAGYVPNATPLITNYVWFAPGTYTFRARAIDDERHVSPWTEHTIVVVVNPPVIIRPIPPQVSLEVDRNLIRVGETTTAALRVKADYDVLCTVYGIAGGRDSFRHQGSDSERAYTYQTATLLATQIVKAVCVPEVSSMAMPTEIRERRVSVASGLREV